MRTLFYAMAVASSVAACTAEAPAAAPTDSESEVTSAVKSCSGRPKKMTLRSAQGSDDGPIAHWKSSECVQVRYDASVEKIMPIVEAAMAEWSKPSCTTLCFSKAKRVDEAPAFDSGVLYITTDKASGETFTEDNVVPRVSADVGSGLVVEAMFAVRASYLDAFTMGDALANVGYALGFERENDDSPLKTVMTHVARGAPRTTLLADDKASVCALYGKQPYCAGE